MKKIRDSYLRAIKPHVRLINLNLVELNGQEVKDVEGGNLIKYFFKLARDYAVTEIGKYAINNALTPRKVRDYYKYKAI